MRLLHLTTFLQGGAGLVIAELAKAQRRLGHDVTVVTSRTGAPGYENYPAHLDTLARAGVLVHKVDSTFFRHEGQNDAVARFVEQMPAFTLVHTHAAVPSAVALRVRSRGARVPVLQTMHGWGVTKRPDEAAHDVAVMNRIDRVVVAARASEQQLVSLGVSRPRIGVVPYGVDAVLPPQVGALAEQMRAWRAGGGVVLCCLGTIGARKNQQLIVDALPLVPERERLMCVMVGEGTTTGLRERALALGVADRVFWAGYRPYAKRFLADADALVLPSLSEGQPLSVLEAFSAGVPVLTSDVPELAELVVDGVTGLHFSPSDPADLAAAISAVCRMTREERERMARFARDTYQSRFTLDRMVDGYMQEYARLI